MLLVKSLEVQWWIRLVVVTVSARHARLTLSYKILLKWYSSSLYFCRNGCLSKSVVDGRSLGHFRMQDSIKEQNSGENLSGDAAAGG